MIADNDTATVLVVDDEAAYVDAYESWLSERYQVKTATGGRAALEQLDRSVDVVLLDRRMPDLSGDDVLETIRGCDLNVRVAMVTAVEPKVDIIDLPFDEYLVKPVTKTVLVQTVETLLVRRDFDDQTRECFSLVAKRSSLRKANEDGSLERSEEFRRLEERINQLRRRTTEQLDFLIDRGVVDRAYADIDS